MKLELKENQGVPSSLLWTLAIISGVTVANIYYNQPLLNRISRDLNISEFTANLIAMCSQIGYAIDVMRDGAKVGELSEDEMNQSNIMSTIAGGQ